MKIFVTGSTGFIGKYVIKNALNKGHEVLALKRKNNKQNYTLDHNRLTWKESNILDIKPNDLNEVQAIIHLACAGVSPKQASFEEMFEINVKSSVHIANIAKEQNIKRLVYSGSFHEYGKSSNKFKKIPTDAPLEPVTLYGATKVAGFFLINSFAQMNNLELVYARIFSAYGDGQNSKNFYPSLKLAALKGKDFKMTSGKQIRDFVTVEEVAEHLVKACTRKDVISGVPFVINIGKGKGESLINFASNQWDLFKAKGKLLPGLIKEREEPNSFIADITNLFEKKRTKFF